MIRCPVATLAAGVMAWLLANPVGSKAGADDARPIESLDVVPAHVALTGPWDRVQLVVSGQTGETAYDLTHAGTVESADEAVAQVTAGGVVRPVGDGTTRITVHYGSLEAAATVTVAGTSLVRPVSLRHEVVPALTKAGCNSGKCHGAPGGKGGFALSLGGFDASHDFAALTRQYGGRRINPASPGESLLLLKPTGRVAHGGGRRFAADDPLAVLLTQWIQAGTPGGADEPAAVGLEIFPASRWLEADALSQQLRVVARFADGASRDVTHLAFLSASREEQAQVSGEGLVTRLGTGEVAVAAAYAGLQATSQIAFLPARDRFVWPDPPEQNEIDRLVFARLKRLRIAPAELADDATFLRRAYLDVCGILPTPADVRQFLADTRSDKRARLVDALVDRPEYADHWAMKWSDRLGCNQRFVGKTGALKYHAWIRHRIASNQPEDQFVRSILTASGGNYTNPPAGFYRLPRTPEERAEHVAQIFLGVRIGCARCHNHPGEAWTQDDYYGLAAFFARIKYRDGPFFNHMYDKEETIVPSRTGEVVHVRTGATVPPKPLGAPPIAAAAQLEGDRRRFLADWLTAPDNPYFARAAVNRIWHQLFGRGIVEPVDDFRSSNPPSHPELLDALARDFAQGGYDRKDLIRTVLLSRTYQLASTANATNAEDERYFSHALVRLLGAEQLLDAIGQATLAPEKFQGFPLGLRAAQLPDGEYPHRFLTSFGRPARSLACACERASDSSLGQALELVGGDLLESKIHAPDGRIARLLAAGIDNAGLVEECFLATLSRFPSPDESAELVRRLEQAPDRPAVAEDILWALLNHPEFLFQH